MVQARVQKLTLLDATVAGTDRGGPMATLDVPRHDGQALCFVKRLASAVSDKTHSYMCRPACMYVYIYISA